MSDADLCNQLRTHVAELGGPGHVANDADLFGTGALKSMQLMELINLLEDTYAVRVEQRDVLTGKLRSLTSIAQLVRERGRAS